MNPRTESGSPAEARKPWLSQFFATAGYVGYIRVAPGTWGSVVSVILYWWLARIPLVDLITDLNPYPKEVLPGGIMIIIGLVFALGGVFVADQAAKFSANKDPQFVVIDEVSGQFFTYLFALAPANWKYLLLGFILFRVFDIWKPFPARQAESLPGGWGIMTDDWVAAIYAAIGIWIARALGL